MERIKIFSRESNKRIFDILIDTETEEVLIESKYPGSKPESVSLHIIIRKINEKIGKQFLKVETTEL